MTNPCRACGSENAQHREGSDYCKGRQLVLLRDQLSALTAERDGLRATVGTQAAKIYALSKMYGELAVEQVQAKRDLERLRLSYKEDLAHSQEICDRLEQVLRTAQAPEVKT